VDEVAGVVRALLGATARPTPDFGLTITAADGTLVTLNLHNLYAEVQGVDAEERETRIRTMVMSTVPGPRPTTWDNAAPRLLPAVRAVSWGAATGEVELVREPLAPFVTVLCAIDAQHGMTYATHDDLRAWGVSERNARARAEANLSALPLEVERRGPTATIHGPDGYASSWLAAPAALDPLVADLGGRVVAVAPDRDQLVLVDTWDAAATVQVLQEAMQRYRSVPRQLSPVAYLLDGHRIRPWTPPPEHPAAPVLANAARILAGVEYSHQRVALDELFARTRTDVYVSRCTVMARDDGSMWTYSLWVEEVTDGLIPQADVVLLTGAKGAGEPIAVAWDHALRIAPNSLERTGYDPPLWRHHGWPDPRTTTALRQVALPFPLDG